MMELVSEGRGFRIWKIDENTHYEQRAELAGQVVSIGLDTPDYIKVRMEEMVMDQLTSRVVDLTDEPMFGAQFLGWEKEEVTDEEGFPTGKFFLRGFGEVAYWPRMEQS